MHLVCTMIVLFVLFLLPIQVFIDGYEDYQVLNDKYIIVVQNNYKGMIDNDNNSLKR